MANKEMVCDNCSNYDELKVIDLSKETRELATLAKEISMKYNVTDNEIVDVYNGMATKKVVEYKLNKHELFGKGTGVKRNTCLRIIRELVSSNILRSTCVVSNDFPISYIKPGDKFESMTDDSKFDFLGEY